jgi:hypothetical protein
MRLFHCQFVFAVALVLPLSVQASKPVYRCPGKPVLYTDALSAKEAQDKGCTTLEGAPITVISNQRPAKVPAANVPSSVGSGSGENRIDPGTQKVRDADARRILEAELRKEEEALAQLKKEYNNGEPERRGDEANYQKYLDRTAEMKSNVARKEGDISALKRELGKSP